MLPLHSVLSFHVNEGKTFTEQCVIQNIFPSSLSSDFFLLSNTLSKLASFPFPPISSQFQDIEHENQSIPREVVERGERQS